jgi:hypothetical protein
LSQARAIITPGANGSVIVSLAWFFASARDAEKLTSPEAL